MISHELSTIQQNAAAQDWLQSCPGYVPPNMEGLDSPFRVAYLPVRTEPKRRKRVEKPRETPERRLERYKANQLPESVVSTLREMAQTMTVPEVAAATGYSESGIKRIEAQGKPFDHNFHQAIAEVPGATAELAVTYPPDGEMPRSQVQQIAGFGRPGGLPPEPAPTVAVPEAAVQTVEGGPAVFVPVK